jgi:hypothetical protein
MAKSQTNAATSASKNLITQAQNQTAPIIAGLQSQSGQLQQNQGNLYTDITGPMQQQNQDIYGIGGNIVSQAQPLATTGGFTPQSEQDFIRQATEGTQATYGVLENQAQQARTATGGLGTGGALSQMARQLSQGQDQATLNAKVGLNQLETSNKIAGMGAEATGAGVQQTATNEQGALLSNLYNQTTGHITAIGQQVLQAMGLNFNTQAEAINALTQLSKNPGFLQTVLGDVTSLGGAAAGVLGGLGSYNRSTAGASS